MLGVGDFHVFDQGHQSLYFGLSPCYHALHLGARPRSNTTAVTTGAAVYQVHNDTCLSAYTILLLYVGVLRDNRSLHSLLCLLLFNLASLCRGFVTTELASL